MFTYFRSCKYSPSIFMVIFADCLKQILIRHTMFSRADIIQNR